MAVTNRSATGRKDVATIPRDGVYRHLARGVAMEAVSRRLQAPLIETLETRVAKIRTAEPLARLHMLAADRAAKGGTGRRQD